MKVLYDISVLGASHTLSDSKTGIFRVVNHGAIGLIASDRCKVSFCASQSNYLQCNQFLTSQSEFKLNRMSMPNDLLSRMYNLIEPTRMSVHGYASHPLKNNMVRFFYHAGKKYTRPIADQDLDRVDIYHSPMHAIPMQVHSHSKIKTFITIHDIIALLFDDNGSKASHLAVKSIVDSIGPETFVLSVSQHTKNDLCNYLPDLDPARVKISHLAAGNHFSHCTDDERISLVKSKCGIPEDCSYMLALSTLLPRKNFPRTVRCFINMLKESHIADLYLVVVGAKELDYEDVLLEIENAGEFSNRIIIAGYLPDQDLSPLYSGSLAFLYLSIYEGFGLPPLEAMKCGTAVITSNTSSLPEVVGDAAIMVDPLDDNSICAAMLEIYENSNMRATLKLKSLQRANEFSWENYTEQVIDAYQAAL